MLHQQIKFGLGLRPTHYQEILASLPQVDWFEVITEDFLSCSDNDWRFLNAIREHYPVSLHGVSLSIGGTDPLNQIYLKALKKLISQLQPLWVSDHFCWTGIDGINTHDLLPLPHTEEVIQHLVTRIQIVQDFLGKQILLENVSSYVDFTVSEITEWDFLSEIANRADCFILLDINNIYVNAFNHGFSAESYLQGVPVARVKQFHLAGHKHCGTHIIDTHDSPIVSDVWDLYAKAVVRFPTVPLIIERDSEIPPLDILLQELRKTQLICEKQGVCCAFATTAT